MAPTVIACEYSSNNGLPSFMKRCLVLIAFCFAGTGIGAAATPVSVPGTSTPVSLAARPVAVSVDSQSLAQTPPGSSKPADEPGTEAKGNIEKPVNLWPLVYQRRTADTSEFEILFSLFAYSRDHDKTDLAVRPFYHRERDPGKDLLKLSILWPMSDYKRVKDDSRLWIVPSFWRRANVEKSRTVFFPFFSHRRDDTKTRLGVLGYTPVTLFDFRRDPENDRVRHRYLIWTYRREGSRRDLSFLPLYEQSTAPGLRSFSLIPIFAYYRDKADDTFRFSMLGFPDTYNLFERRRRGTEMSEWHFLIAYRHVSTEARRLVLFPLYWDLASHGDRTLHVWPFYSRIRKGTSIEHATVYPLFRVRSDPAGGEWDLKLFWPLLRIASGPGAFRHHRFFPLYASTSNPDSDERPRWMPAGLASPLPVFYRARGQGFSYGRFLWLAWWADNDRKKLAFVLNYYSVEDKVEEWRHRGLFPLWHSSRWGDKQVDFIAPTYVSYRDPDLTLRTFFPLYFHYRSTETSWSTFVPFHFAYRSDPLSLRIIFPFYYHTKNDQLRSEFSYYFPFYGIYRRGDSVSRHLLFFPLFARFHDAQTGYRSLDVLWPLIHRDESPDSSSTRLLPLYWSSRTSNSRFRIAFPLLWEFESPSSSQRHVIPFYGRYRRADGFTVRYAGGPLFIGIEDPAQQYSKRAYLGFLAGRTVDGDERRSYAFPLYWSKSSPDASRLFILPIFGHETAGPRSTLFFLGFKRDLNLFQFSRDPTTAYRESRALLFYSRRDAGSFRTVLFPLYWGWGGDQTRTSLLFPLYAWQTDRYQKERSLSLIGLHQGLSLFHFLRNETEDRRIARVLIFGRYQHAASRMYTVFPLFWHFSKPEETRSLLFPLYHYNQNKEDGKNRLGIIGVTPLVSLFAYRNEPEVFSNRLWPLYGYRSGHKPAERELGLIGVYYPYSILHFRSSPEGYAHHLFPLYDYTREGAKASPERKVKGSLLWQVVSYKREGPEEADFRVLWRLVRIAKRDGGRAFEFNPFYFSLREKDKGRYWAVLGGLVGRETRLDGSRRWRLFWFF